MMKSVTYLAFLLLLLKTLVLKTMKKKISFVGPVLVTEGSSRQAEIKHHKPFAGSKTAEERNSSGRNEALRQGRSTASSF